jgi:hypothetical protein
MTCPAPECAASARKSSRSRPPSSMHGRPHAYTPLYQPTPLIRLTPCLHTSPLNTTAAAPGPYLPKPREIYESMEIFTRPKVPNIVTANDGHYWRAVRQAAAPCFSMSNLKQVSGFRPGPIGAHVLMCDCGATGLCVLLQHERPASGRSPKACMLWFPLALSDCSVPTYEF